MLKREKWILVLLPNNYFSSLNLTYAVEAYTGGVQKDGMFLAAPKSTQK
jgi:hypothetical protein